MSLDTFHFWVLLSQVQVSCGVVLSALGEEATAAVWIVIGAASLLAGVLFHFWTLKAGVSAP